MRMALGILAGVVWGALAALLNARITRRALEKNNTRAMMNANLLRTGVDLLALAAVFFLRRLLPFSFEAMLVATAVTLSLLTMLLAYRMSRPLKKAEEQKPEDRPE